IDLQDRAQAVGHCQGRRFVPPPETRPIPRCLRSVTCKRELVAPWIGVGKPGSSGLPSLRTGRADFPHPALQLVDLTRADESVTGINKGEEPVSLEVGYGPALMISAPSTSSQLHATTEDAAQAPANP